MKKQIAIRTFDSNFMVPSGLQDLNEALTQEYIVVFVTRGNNYIFLVFCLY